MVRRRAIQRFAHQAFIDIASAAALTVMPWRLLRAARQMSATGMYLLGLLAGIILFVVVLGAGLSGIDEPFLTVDSYLTALATGVSNIMRIAIILCIPLVPAAAVVHFVPSRERPLIGLMTLWTIPLLVPMCAISCVWIVNRIAHDVVRGAQRPLWVYWPGWDFLGSCWWVIALLVADGAIVVLSWRRIYVEGGVDPSRCGACGYDLRNSTSGQCPECGAAIIT